MNTFNFNGKNSYTDFKLGIIGNSTRPRPQEVTETEEVEGRRGGSLVYKTGTYKDLIVKRKLRLLKWADYETETLRIMNWLTNITDNRLVLADYPNKCYRVKYVKVDDFEDYRGGNVDFNVEFICEPFLYNSNDVEQTIATGTVIVNDGFLEAEPYITLTLPTTAQNISITVGAKTLQLNSVAGTVVIDCKALRVIQGNTEIKTIGSFPTLAVGNNTISWAGTITTFKIKKNLVYRG